MILFRHEFEPYSRVIQGHTIKHTVRQSLSEIKTSLNRYMQFHACMCMSNFALIEQRFSSPNFWEAVISAGCSCLSNTGRQGFSRLQGLPSKTFAVRRGGQPLCEHGMSGSLHMHASTTGTHKRPDVQAEKHKKERGNVMRALTAINPRKLDLRALVKNTKDDMARLEQLEKEVKVGALAHLQHFACKASATASFD